MRLSSTVVCLAAVLSLGSAAARAQTALHADSIERSARDGVVRLYGAGGPHTAFRKVADLWEKRTGQRVEIVAGPESDWSRLAQRNADILWGTSEQSMSAFLRTYTTFDSADVRPIYLRPAVIAVAKGNPLGISGFDDLLKPGRRVVVTEGKGVYNTSGTGLWEDVAGRKGKLSDIRRLRRNIVAFALGSGASFQAFQDRDADAWITWPSWPITKSDTLDLVPLDEDRVIYRDVNVVLAPDADVLARSFLDFLETGTAQRIMATEGWQR